MKLTVRSYQKELLDADNIPMEAIRQNMIELDTINTLLGGHRISISGFKKLLGNKKKISVCEIGCGGGDNLIALQKWCDKNNIHLSTIGIDIKKEVIEFASARRELVNTTFIISDYSIVHFDQQPDIIFSSLFCHHFTNEALIKQFTWMKEHCNIGFFINDLHRHTLAYYSIKILTGIFSKSYLVKHDAPLSVARGFVKNELKKLLIIAGIHSTTVEWKWAFRYLIVYQHG